VLQSFLDLKSGDIEQAAQHYTDVQTWRDAIGPVSISTIEKFLRSGTYMIPLQYPAPDGGYQHPPIILMVRGEERRQGGASGLVSEHGLTCAALLAGRDGARHTR
jgi:hypothetical protein